MPAKTPIYLKSTNTRKGKKCRLRDILSADMISPPLGDFRHTLHIGAGGERDAFGDMSFLQGKYELLPGKREKPQSVAFGEFLRAKSTSEAPSLETASPVLKNAISLPTIGGSQALTLPLISSMSLPPHPDPFDSVDLTSSSFLQKSDELEPNMLLLSLDVFSSKPAHEATSTSDFLTEVFESQDKTSHEGLSNNGRSCPSENGFKVPSEFHSNSNGTVPYGKNLSGHYTSQLKHGSTDEERIGTLQFKLPKEECGSQDSISKMNGSLLSLELDLGPSILDDVLNIMDRPKTGIKP